MVALVMMARSNLLLYLGTLAACVSCHHVSGFGVFHGPARQQVKPLSTSCLHGRLSHTTCLPILRSSATGRTLARTDARRGRGEIINPPFGPLLLSTAADAAEQANMALATVPSTESAASPSKKPSPVVSGLSLAGIVIADLVLKRAFLRAGLAFPSSLAGMVGLFAGFVTLETIAPEAAEKVVGVMEPGSALLARWLPVFFVPTLVILPLSPSPSVQNALRLLVIVFGGWFLSLAFTAAVVEALLPGKPAIAAGAGAPVASPKPPSVFKKPLIQSLGVGAALAGATSIAAFGSMRTLFGFSLGKLALPARQLSLLFATLFGFSAGTRMPKQFTKVVHPVVTCTAAAMTTVAVIGRACAVGFPDMLRSYVTRSRCPVHLGAGDLLLGLLGPSVLSFAVQMYRRRVLIFKNAKPVVGGSIFCATSGLFGTAVASRVIGLPADLRLATLPRNITSPLAMAICSILGADTSLAIAIVVISGVIGANFGATALDLMGVKDPAARGLAQGGSAHGLGTAAIVNESTAFAFSAVAMALTATASTVLVSIPAVRAALLAVALGGSGVVPIP